MMPVRAAIYLIPRVPKPIRYEEAFSKDTAGAAASFLPVFRQTDGVRWPVHDGLRDRAGEGGGG